MNRYTSLSIALIAGILVASGPGRAADYTMKIGMVTGNDQQHIYAQRYEKELEKATGGRIDVKVFPRGQLGTPARHIEGLQVGTVEAFITPFDFFVGVDARYGVFSIPGMFKDKQHASRTMRDPALNKEILSIAANKGIIGITAFPHSVAHYFGKTPILSLDDFKGKKFRVNATPAERERMNRFGASAVPMPLGEVVPSLQRGVIDGTMSGIAIYVFRKFIDLGNVVTVTNDTLIISQVAVSKAWLSSLPADLQKAVVDTGLGLQDWINEHSDVMEAGLTEKWLSMGGKLHKFSASEQAELEKRLASVGADVTKSDPAVSAFFERVKQVGKKY